MKIINSLIIGSLGVLSTLYLLNPGAGIFFEIPDNIPIIGNLDEAAAVAMLISCLAYFGIDIPRIFGRGAARSKDEEHESAKAVDAKVID